MRDAPRRIEQASEVHSDSEPVPARDKLVLARRRKTQHDSLSHWDVSILEGPAYFMVLFESVKPVPCGSGSDFEIRVERRCNSVSYIPRDWSDYPEEHTPDWAKNYVTRLLAKQ